MSGPPRTVAEASGFSRTSTHAEALAFLQALRARRDPRLFLTSFGISREGRELPLAVWADPPVRSPAEAAGRVRAFVMANIHAGEVEGKEACLALLRDLAWGLRTPRRGDLVLLVAPVYNADGNDRMGCHRPDQNGPDRVGVRPTADGLDLNRDSLKLEAMEARALARLLASWDPHLVVDLHTTNGTDHGYELTYAPPLHPSCHPELLGLLTADWLPALRRRMREGHGFETFDYGNLEEGAWRTFDHRPRFGNSCVGLRNRLCILSEAYAYADFRTRIDATRAFVEEILDLAASRGEGLRAACVRWDRETAADGGAGRLSQAVSARMALRGEETLLLRDAEALAGGRRIASGPRREAKVPCWTSFEADAEVRSPAGWILDPSLAEAAALASRHGILVRRLEEPCRLPVTSFTLASRSQAAEPFQGHRLNRTAWTCASGAREVPAGAFLVPAGQPLARLAFQLLDPRAEDGILAWNLLDPWLREGAELPLYGLEAGASNSAR